MKLNKIILAGGTGFLGQAIIDKFKDFTTQIIVLTRGQNRQEKNIIYLRWDGKTLGKWSEELNNADVVINLTGKSVDCRYTEKNKAEIMSSRVDATLVLAEAINKAANPPAVWLNCASATIYNHSEDKPMDEFTGETGSGFSVEVCKKWEDSFNQSLTPKTRKVGLRISMVLGKGGGVLPVMKKLVNAGLGGKMGDGNQYISWIHEKDFINVVMWLLEHADATGSYNLSAPEPIKNADFMKIFRQSLHKKLGLPANKFMLEIGAFFLRTETELILKSRRVVPGRLLKEGFIFEYTRAQDALKNLLN